MATKNRWELKQVLNKNKDTHETPVNDVLRAKVNQLLSLFSKTQGAPQNSPESVRIIRDAWSNALRDWPISYIQAAYDKFMRTGSSYKVFPSPKQIIEVMENLTAEELGFMNADQAYREAHNWKFNRSSLTNWPSKPFGVAAWKIRTNDCSRSSEKTIFINSYMNSVKNQCFGVDIDCPPFIIAIENKKPKTRSVGTDHLKQMRSLRFF